MAERYSPKPEEVVDAAKFIVASALMVLAFIGAVLTVPLRKK